MGIQQENNEVAGMDAWSALEEKTFERLAKLKRCHPVSTGRGKELAEAHWGYISGLLDAHGVEPGTIALIEHHYTTAFVHGYKHGQEDANGEHHDK